MQHDAIETVEIGPMVGYLYPDLDPMNPRTEWDHATTLALPGHRQYDLGDDDARQRYGWCESIEELANALHDDGYVSIVPVYLLDHSGLALRAGRGFGDVDPGEWDSGIVGFGAMSAEQWKACQGTDWQGDTAQGKRMREIIVGEIDEYGQYLTGDVYGCVVTHSGTGEIVESCWGFFGYNYALEELTAMTTAAAADAEDKLRAALAAAGPLHTTDL